MRLLHAGIDTTVIPGWLGHEHVETTQIYLDADMALQEPRSRNDTARHTTRPLPATRHAPRILETLYYADPKRPDRPPPTHRATQIGITRTST